MSKILKKLGLILASTLVMASIFSGVALAKDDGNSIYIEENQVKGSDALNIIQNTETFNYFNAFQQERSSVEVYAVATKSVYVKETADDNDNVIDSKLMTNNEVAKLKKELGRGWIFIGSPLINPSTYKKLTCTMSVYQETADNSYIILTNATWEHLGVYISGESTPADKGYMAIAWGGNGEAFAASSMYFSGKYQNGSNMSSYSLAKSDTYNGYCWQFDETTGGLFASPMDYADAHVTINKKYPAYVNLLTNVKFTYIHTWESVKPTITFGNNGSVSFSTSSTKWWPLEMDVAGLLY